MSTVAAAPFSRATLERIAAEAAQEFRAEGWVDPREALILGPPIEQWFVKIPAGVAPWPVSDLSRVVQPRGLFHHQMSVRTPRGDQPIGDVETRLANGEAVLCNCGCGPLAGWIEAVLVKLCAAAEPGAVKAGLRLLFAAPHQVIALWRCDVNNALDRLWIVRADEGSPFQALQAMDPTDFLGRLRPAAPRRPFPSAGRNPGRAAPEVRA